MTDKVTDGLKDTQTDFQLLYALTLGLGSTRNFIIVFLMSFTFQRGEIFIRGQTHGQTYLKYLSSYRDG